MNSNISSIKSCESTSKVLIIYTGGTLGMQFDKRSKSLVPTNYKNLGLILPDLGLLEVNIDFITSSRIIDSSNVTPDDWIEWANIIVDCYNTYNGFLILHGTDTMSYSASALSFMLQGLSKPVVLTGAQLPIGVLRSDAKRNIISSIEIILSMRKDGTPMVQEVAVFFNDLLLRGNRSVKVESDDFDAFESKNYPELANIGVSINFNIHALKIEKSDFKPLLSLNPRQLATVKLYPGMDIDSLDYIFNITRNIVVIIETYGSGNAPVNDSFLELIKRYIAVGGIVVNVSQCARGKVEPSQYEANTKLTELGVINASDITFEAVTTKAMWLLGNFSAKLVAAKIRENLQGELTE